MVLSRFGRSSIQDLKVTDSYQHDLAVLSSKRRSGSQQKFFRNYTCFDNKRPHCRIPTVYTVIIEVKLIQQQCAAQLYLTSSDGRKASHRTNYVSRFGRNSRQNLAAIDSYWQDLAVPGSKRCTCQDHSKNTAKIGNRCRMYYVHGTYVLPMRELRCSNSNNAAIIEPLGRNQQFCSFN